MPAIASYLCIVRCALFECIPATRGGKRAMRPFAKLFWTLVCGQERRAKERLEQKRERKAARTLAVITGSFVMCWLPFFIVALVCPFCAERCLEIPPLVLSVIGWLGYLNSLLNPIIYTVFNPDFRSAFRKILYGKYRRRPGTRRRRPRRHCHEPPTCTTIPAITTDFTA